MDPITAFAMAQGALKAIRSGVEFYKECQYTFQHIDKPKKVVTNDVEPNEHGSLFKFSK